MGTHVSCGTLLDLEVRTNRGRNGKGHFGSLFRFSIPMAAGSLSLLETIICIVVEFAAHSACYLICTAVKTYRHEVITFVNSFPEANCVFSWKPFPAVADARRLGVNYGSSRLASGTKGSTSKFGSCFRSA